MVLSILPVAFQFQGHDQLTVPIDRIRDASVADWVNAKLLDFVDAFLRTQTLDQCLLSQHFTESSERDRDIKALGASEISWQED